jgi:phage-related protein
MEIKLYFSMKLKDVIYVLHSFQKKSKQGISTPKHEIEVIEKRMKRTVNGGAIMHHEMGGVEYKKAE